MSKLNRTAMIAISAGLVVAAASSSADTKLLKFAHDNITDPLENPAHACAAVFNNIIETESNGSITTEVFPSNQLGNAREHVQLLRDNVIQATLTSTGAIASYYPRIDVLNLPFAFDSNASTYEVFDGAFGEALAADIEQVLGDVEVLGFPDTGGFFAITNSKKPIRTLADFEGIRIRTMTVPAHQTAIQSLGGQAYPLAWGEVYTGLQTGVIDGQMNPIPIISTYKMYEVQDYMTLTNHLFSPYTFMVSSAFYDSLTEQEQAIVRKAAESCVVASRGIARVIEASDRGLAGLVDQIEVSALSDEDRAGFRDAAQPAVIELIENSGDPKAVELLNLFRTEVEQANEVTSHYMD
ncbi:TRAP transporter substrate-binding protein [Sedimentitalea nanhaiensis]|uniref:Tripartite ATP-independent transporter solute receptor, DctP family n=1 Tax=Sedimentitalea nanhaiensis TaxID=999627 RepID=A0A1I7CKB8_9RHOB|nr:DctP family TRAP transporter solute-binding subunit [Sedimentitalea nanhaiensis]SFT99858.1 tripartite ATP-independent transporter solute receptor, DctP family [Sedimentitalea nanhaiensis]